MQCLFTGGLLSALVLTSDTVACSLASHCRYDIDGSGTLDSNEIVFMLLSTQMSANPAAAAVLDMIHHMDESCSGYVKREDFSVRVLLNTEAVGVHWHEPASHLTERRCCLLRCSTGQFDLSSSWTP